MKWKTSSIILKMMAIRKWSAVNKLWSIRLLHYPKKAAVDIQLKYPLVN